MLYIMDLERGNSLTGREIVSWALPLQDMYAVIVCISLEIRPQATQQIAYFYLPYFCFPKPVSLSALKLVVMEHQRAPELIASLTLVRIQL